MTNFIVKKLEKDDRILDWFCDILEILPSQSQKKAGEFFLCENE